MLKQNFKKLSLIQEKLQEFDRTILELENAANFLEYQKKEYIFTQIKDKIEPSIDSDDIEVGTWDCSKSPIGICCFDVDNDPCKDFCLFCNYPEERK